MERVSKCGSMNQHYIIIPPGSVFADMLAIAIDGSRS
jgi:hypothetical protein